MLVFMTLQHSEPYSSTDVTLMLYSGILVLKRDYFRVNLTKSGECKGAFPSLAFLVGEVMHKLKWVTCAWVSCAYHPYLCSGSGIGAHHVSFRSIRDVSEDLCVWHSCPVYQSSVNWNNLWREQRAHRQVKIFWGKMTVLSFIKCLPGAMLRVTTQCHSITLSKYERYW